MPDKNEYMVLDIETVPCQSLPPECVPVFDESSVALGNLKDPIKIREKVENERSKFEAGLQKSMSLNPDLCQVCCTVLAETDPDIPPHVARTAGDQEEEFEMISDTWNILNRMVISGEGTLVTFNGKSFDLQVLYRRAMFLDIGVNRNLFATLTKRFDTKFHIDLMEVLSTKDPFSGKPNFKGLDYYLKRFGLGGKMDGMTGADVYTLFQEKEEEKIFQYCLEDVRKTAQLFDRVSPWIIT